MNTEESLKTNLNMLICRAYLTLFEKLFIINKNIIPLQRIFRKKLQIKIVKQKKLNFFLNLQNGNYLNFRHENYVKLRWNLEKDKNIFLQKIKIICDEQNKRRKEIEINILPNITRYKW